MVLVDGERRYVDANRPARLAFRLSLEELRSHAVDDLTPPELSGVMEETWNRLLVEGSAAGRYVAGHPGCPLEIVFCAVADALPGLHAGAFAPATWPADELDALADEAGDPPAPLTPRETEVLTLAAYGRSGPQIAAELVLSPATVKTHFSNIHGKLAVPNRTAAVARALKLGMID
jgi:DNA-binding CsgD family transcriptional regulator